MEYLSLPHTRASTYKLVPEVNDELLTNLRNPIITLVEDTTPGAHDTLTAACDANLYRNLGVDTPEEHGSCAENLVLALKEINESVGLKGAKAVGADITVNIAPTPLHLFMNAPLQVSNEKKEEGSGANGAVIKVEEPKGKKRSFVRFRAERDVVIVFSACPVDVGLQNGGRCMAANFMVEDLQEGENLASSVSSLKQKRPAPRKLKSNADVKKNEQKTAVPKRAEPKEAKTSTSTKSTKESTSGKVSELEVDKKDESKKGDKNDVIPRDPKDEKPQCDTPKEDFKPKKKPKKLQVRSQGTLAPSKGS